MSALSFLRRQARRFVRDECGSTAVEYAALLALLLAVCIAAVAAFQPGAGAAFQSSGDTMGTYGADL